jgi:glycosyltransferase involved in cell wall biosynthesis
MTARVAICVITCRRPEGLAHLLDSLANLTFRDPPDLRVVVVDNDPDGSAAAVCSNHRLPWPLALHHEPRRGIPIARNTAVAHAGDVDWIAFIDDDEIPVPHWLDELLRVQRSSRADVVAGPVLSDLGEHPPTWAVRGRFFERPRRPTGTRIENAFTGNVLYCRNLLGNAPFNEEMALMGGSDAYLSRELCRRHARMVWADEAVVTEKVPASRMRVTWVWRRAFRAGVSRSYAEQKLARSMFERARAAAQGPRSLGKNIVRSPLALVRGWHGGIEAARRVCYGAGMVAGTVGVRYQEYATVHGR